MTRFKSILFVAILSSSILHPALVQATLPKEEYQEVSYDDLVNELHSRKKKLITPERSSFDKVKVHAGVGYTNSFTNIAAQKQNFNRHATGIQLSLGMDLFSPNWYSEGVFKNYGLTSQGNEEFTLRELDLKIGYKNQLESIWSFNLSSGIANRFLHFKDSSRNMDVDNTTPSFIISTGFSAQVHRNISIGAEFTAHNSIISQTADKNSFDFAFRINTSL